MTLEEQLEQVARLTDEVRAAHYESNRMENVLSDARKDAWRTAASIFGNLPRNVVEIGGPHALALWDQLEPVRRKKP